MHLGMAFQIIDDLLDYTEEEAVTGKRSGSDLREHKVTLPLIHALPLINEEERAQVEVLMKAAEPTDGQIADVVAAVTRGGGLDYARSRAQALGANAERLLELLPPTPAREALSASVSYVLERRS